MTRCAGEPEGSCAIEVAAPRIWCRVCLTRRQESIALGLPLGSPVPVGIILQDFDAPVLMCQCGGTVEGHRHKESLLHRQWAWSQAPFQRGVRDRRVRDDPFVPPWEERRGR